MPSRTTEIRLGVLASSLRPVSEAAPATAPVAAPPITATASSGSTAARTLRNTSTLSRTISPVTRALPIVAAVRLASALSDTWARPPVNPVRMPRSANRVRASSRKALKTPCTPSSEALPANSTESSSKVRSGATVAGAIRGVWERSVTRNSGSSARRGIVTRWVASFAASDSIRCWSAAPSALPSVRATSTVTVVASDFTPKCSSPIRCAAAES